MTPTVGSQVFGPWYDILGAVLMSGMFFYLAFAAPTLPLSVKKYLPAFLSKRFCIAVAICWAGMAFFNAASMPAPAQEIPAATMTAFGAAPEWKIIHTGSEGETLSIDLKSIANNGDAVGYSEQLAFTTPRPFPMPVGTVASMKARRLVNCADRTHVIQEFVMVRSDGSAVFQDKTAEPPVLPLSADPSRPDYISSNYMCGSHK